MSYLMLPTEALPDPNAAPNHPHAAATQAAGRRQGGPLLAWAALAIMAATATAAALLF
jgi:hypothetical protein